MADKKSQINGQAEWEAQKRLRDELEARKKMNQAVMYHFDDDYEVSQRLGNILAKENTSSFFLTIQTTKASVREAGST
jgi:hypothetical protein